MENSFKLELKAKRVWLCVDGSTDYQKNSVLYDAVCIMKPLKPSLSIYSTS